MQLKEEKVGKEGSKGLGRMALNGRDRSGKCRVHAGIVQSADMLTLHVPSSLLYCIARRGVLHIIHYYSLPTASLNTSSEPITASAIVSEVLRRSRIDIPKDQKSGQGTSHL
jgi:hypothetical protein